MKSGCSIRPCQQHSIGRIVRKIDRSVLVGSKNSGAVPAVAPPPNWIPATHPRSGRCSPREANAIFSCLAGGVLERRGLQSSPAGVAARGGAMPDLLRTPAGAFHGQNTTHKPMRLAASTSDARYIRKRECHVSCGTVGTSAGETLGEKSCLARIATRITPGYLRSCRQHRGSGFFE